MSNKCLRCGRHLKDPFADYGPVCGKKVADDAQHNEHYPTVVRNKKGDITAVIV